MFYKTNVHVVRTVKHYLPPPYVDVISLGCIPWNISINAIGFEMSLKVTVSMIPIFRPNFKVLAIGYRFWPYIFFYTKTILGQSWYHSAGTLSIFHIGVMKSVSEYVRVTLFQSVIKIACCHRFKIIFWVKIKDKISVNCIFTYQTLWYSL